MILSSVVVATGISTTSPVPAFTRRSRPLASRGAGMRLTTFRSWLYWLAKMIGDYRAVRTVRVARRVGYRIAGKATGRAFGGLFR